MVKSKLINGEKMGNKMAVPPPGAKNTRFKPGHTPAHKGKVLGPRKPKAMATARANMFDQVITEEEQQRFLQQCWHDACNGDETMKMFFAERLRPAHKPTLPPVRLPEHDSSDPVSVCSATLAALGDGAVTPDQAAAILSAVESLVATAQGVTLGDELAQLSKTIEDMSGG